MTVTALAATGSNIVVASDISDASSLQFKFRLPSMGIQTKFVTSRHIDDVRHAIDENTKAVFVESISSQSLLISDIAAIATACHDIGVPLVVYVYLTPLKSSAATASNFGINSEIEPANIHTLLPITTSEL